MIKAEAGKKDMKTSFSGYTITDAAVFDRFCIFAQVNNYDFAQNYRDERLVRQRVAWYRPGGAGGFATVREWEPAQVAGTPDPNKEVVLVPRNGDGIAKVNGVGASVEDGGPLAALPARFGGQMFCARVKALHGRVKALHGRVKALHGRVYGCGAHGLVFVRVGEERWEFLPSPAQETEKSHALNGMFVDLDAFAPDDLYAVGGDRIWHFDGQGWTFDTCTDERNLSAVCCGPDGTVYAAGKGGVLYKGCAGTWTALHPSERLQLQIKDMVAYQGAIWATNDDGVWLVGENGLQTADIPAEIAVCAGNLAVSSEIMLLAGVEGAAYLDGKTWRLICHNDKQFVDQPGEKEYRAYCEACERQA